MILSGDKGTDMTFKECRKYGREEINRSNRNYGFMYKDKNGDYTFSFVHYTSMQPEYVLERNGVVDKVINGQWQWDFEKRGHCPKNEKGWNKRGDT